MSIPDGRLLKVLVAAALFLAFAVQPAAASSPIPVHSYDLNGSLADSLGGPDLIPEGGTLGADSYAFGPNQGLTLVGPDLTNPGEYSIELVVTLDTVRGPTFNPWVKLIDYRNLTDDRGLYSFDSDGDDVGVLQFYPYSSTTDAFYDGEAVHVVITRDDTTDEVIAYALGVGDLSFIDWSGAAVMNAANTLRFLQDDFPTGEFEATSGSIDFIRIYDRVLTPEEVAELANQAFDADGDGVGDGVDVCPDTEIPDPNIPTKRLGTNRWALVDDDGIFDTVDPKGKGPMRSYTIDDTAGCNAEQIADALGLGKGHYKHGLSISAMDDWVALVNP